MVSVKTLSKLIKSITLVKVFFKMPDVLLQDKVGGELLLENVTCLEFICFKILQKYFSENSGDY